MDGLTHAQAIENLHGIAEQVALNGRDRDIARASVALIRQGLAEREKLLAEKESPAASKPTAGG